MIKERKKKNTVVSTTAERLGASRKAKKQAALEARRGMRSSAKPTQKEVAFQLEQELAKKKQKEMKTDTNKLRRKSTAAQAVASVVKKGKQNVIPPSMTRPPTRKAINAAITAMENAGFKVPDGMQMIISFAPAIDTPTKKPAKKEPKKDNKKKKGKK